MEWSDSQARLESSRRMFPVSPVATGATSTRQYPTPRRWRLPAIDLFIDLGLTLLGLTFETRGASAQDFGVRRGCRTNVLRSRCGGASRHPSGGASRRASGGASRRASSVGAPRLPPPPRRTGQCQGQQPDARSPHRVGSCARKRTSTIAALNFHGGKGHAILL